MIPGYNFYPATLPPAGDRGSDARTTQAPPTAPQFPAPVVTPMVAFVLPSYMFPQLGMSASPPFYAEQQPGVGAQQPNYNPQNPLQPQQTQPNYTTQQPFQPQQDYTVPQAFMPQHVYVTQNPFQPQAPFQPPQPFQMQFTPQTPLPYQMTSDPRLPVPESAEVPSPSPLSCSPPLFGSHCSSPLQLDLLQLEDKADSHSTTPLSGARGNCSSAQEKSSSTADVQQVRAVLC